MCVVCVLYIYFYFLVTMANIIFKERVSAQAIKPNTNTISDVIYVHGLRIWSENNTVFAFYLYATLLS